MLLENLIIPSLNLLKLLDLLLFRLHLFDLEVKVILCLGQLGLVSIDHAQLLGKLRRWRLSGLLLELLLIECNIVGLELFLHGLRLEGQVVPLSLCLLELLFLLLKEELLILQSLLELTDLPISMRKLDLELTDLIRGSAASRGYTAGSRWSLQ